jgi:putative N6-adenine-specific DNA methylase
MIDYQKTNTYFAQIADGLEATGAANWLNWARQHPTGSPGHPFQADPAALYRINYCTRLCTRILAPIQSFACPDAAAIYRAARRIDWPRFSAWIRPLPFLPAPPAAPCPIPSLQG